VIANVVLDNVVLAAVQQVVQSLPTGSYFGLAKIIIMIVALFLWAYPAGWVRRDAVLLNLPQFLWGVVIMSAATVGWLLWFVVPIFSVGLAIWLVSAMGSILVYTFYRDSLVQAEDRIISFQNTLDRIRGEKKPTNVTAEIKVHLSTPTGQEIGVPDKEDQRELFQQVQDLMFDAFWRRASDIYIQPAGQSGRIAFRIDGVLNEYRTIERQAGDMLVNYIKTIAGMDVQQRRLPQKGRLVAQQLKVKEKMGLDIESSGSTAGERLTIRVRSQEARYTIEDLGFTEEQLGQLGAVLDQSRGIVVLCGMGGCGVSTTLYGIGRTHDAFTRNIHSMESKPLMELDNVTQNIYRSDEEASFTRQLQSVFRRDPDIVLIDPCPDPETAKLVAEVVRRGEKKAYLTLRASSCLSGLARFVKWIESPGVAANVLLMVTFQRLVRKLCPACREGYRPNPDVLRKMNLASGQEVTFYRPPVQQQVDKKGNPIICPTCQGTGYFGRTAIMETLTVTDEVRKAISSGSATDMKAAARRSGMKYWQEAAIHRVMEGVTSMQEIVRISKEQAEK